VGSFNYLRRNMTMADKMKNVNAGNSLTKDQMFFSADVVLVKSHW
jgi:hypothetical protein